MKTRPYGVRLDAAPGSNVDPLIIVSLARHLADFAPEGIRAKRGATNRRFAQKGSITLRFASRKARQAYLDLIACHGPDGLRFQRTRRRQQTQ